MKTKFTVAATLVLLALLAAQGAAQQWTFVARLSSDASRGESMIRVETLEPVVSGRALLIEDRDGAKREVYKVHAVFDGFNVILETRLKSDFAAGAKIFQ